MVSQRYSPTIEVALTYNILWPTINNSTWYVRHYFQLWQLTAFADWASSNFHKSIFTVHATYGWALLWTTFWKV